MSSPISQISRRRFLSAAGGTLLAGTFASAAEPQAPGPTLHAYASYGWLRGFSVIPSWAARIEDAWWFYDGARLREEVSLARQVHGNCIRLWIEFTAWMRDPERITAHFLDAVKGIGEAGLKVMPCLFNRWHDRDYDYGGTYIENLRSGHNHHVEYVRALVTPLIADPAVLIWDLCNEPQAQDLKSEPNQKEFSWLKTISETVRACGARQPITIGTMNGGNITTYAPLVDVLCAHPYAQNQPGLERIITGYQEMSASHSKPMLVNECIPGALEDSVRAEVARYYTQSLSAAGLGWLGWALREGKAISTRRDRYDGNGIKGQGFHPFFTKEGKLRGGLEFLTEKPKQLPPWEKA